MHEKDSNATSGSANGVSLSGGDVFDRIVAASRTRTGMQARVSEDAESPGPAPREKALREPAFFLFPEYLALTLKPLPGYVWIVFLVLWRKSMMTRSWTVSVTSTALQPFGVTRMQKARALAALTRVGLITVAHQAGKNPLITIEVDTPPWKH